jgi:tetratricopeptide (TPR) repeat protein
LDCYIRLANRDPENVEWPRSAGHILANLGRPTEAEHWINKAISIEPRNSDLLLLRCRLLSEQGDFKAALTDAMRANGLDSQSSLATYWVSLCWLDLNNPQAGIIFAKRTVELSPAWHSGWIILATMQNLLDEKEAAIQSYQRSLKFEVVPGVQSDLAELLHQTGDDEGALLLFTQALEAEPHLETALNGCAILRLNSTKPSVHNKSEALRLIRVALSIDPENQLYLELQEEILSELDKKKQPL